MPVTMSGSPGPTKQHWFEQEQEILVNHTALRQPEDALLSRKQLKQKRENAFQARQRERLMREAAEAQYEKEKRAEMTARLEKRLELQPGYGARHPRSSPTQRFTLDISSPRFDSLARDACAHRPHPLDVADRRQIPSHVSPRRRPPH